MADHACCPCVERLTTALRLSETKLLNTGGDVMLMAARADAAERDVERLRAALRVVAESDCEDYCCEMARCATCIARAALERVATLEKDASVTDTEVARLMQKLIESTNARKGMFTLWCAEKARADAAEAEVEERKRQLDALIQMRSDDIARWRAANARLTAAIKDAEHDTDSCGSWAGEPCDCWKSRAIEEGK